MGSSAKVTTSSPGEYGPITASIRGMRPTGYLLLALVTGVCCAALAWYVDDAGFFLLGIVGAIFANSTGAGGGVVFIPTFGQLAFTDGQAVATSFGIQCFGMTAGALTWFWHYKTHQKLSESWRCFLPLIAICSGFSVLGLWSTYGWNFAAPAGLQNIFSVFSLVLGTAILASLFLAKPGVARNHVHLPDAISLVVISYAGGLVTAWLSVGVGELIAFYLIFRRYDVTMAIATAVIVSALTVWSATPEHVWQGTETQWHVVLMAGPGAVLGGILARTLVNFLSARKLKIFFGAWLLVIGFAGFGPLY